MATGTGKTFTAINCLEKLSEEEKDLITVIACPYAHLVEQKNDVKVSKMHLYYTGEEDGLPTITFEKSSERIESTIKEFDEVVDKIQNKDFSGRAKDKKLCQNCDLRHYCRRKES